MPKTKFRPRASGKSGRTNGERALSAEYALRNYKQFELKVEVVGKDRRSYRRKFKDILKAVHAITELVADIGHLCDREGILFDGIIENAKLHWKAER